MIWLIDVASGGERPLVPGTGNHFSPRWSPDGRRLAYASTAEGGSPQLFVRWMDSGESVRVTGLPDSPSGLAWSPDGRRLAYLMNVPGDGMKLGSAPAKPEGAEWAKPLEIIDKVIYRADGAGYIKPGFDHLFMVDALGGAPLAQRAEGGAVQRRFVADDRVVGRERRDGGIEIGKEARIVDCAAADDRDFVPEALEHARMALTDRSVADDEGACHARQPARSGSVRLAGVTRRVSSGTSRSTTVPAPIKQLRPMETD